MSSVSGVEVCPRCGLEEYNVYLNCRSCEFYSICFGCGYYKNVVIKRDCEGNYIRKDPTGSFHPDNLIWLNDELIEPYGFYQVYRERMATDIGSLADVHEYNEFKVQVSQWTKQDADIALVTVKRFVNGEMVKEIIFERDGYSDDVDPPIPTMMTLRFRR
jgi:hypothetical protein